MHTFGKAPEKLFEMTYCIYPYPYWGEITWVSVTPCGSRSPLIVRGALQETLGAWAWLAYRSRMMDSSSLALSWNWSSSDRVVEGREV